MKHNTWMLIILLVTNFCAMAQSTETIRVNAGDDIATAVSSYGIYRFPAFTSGMVFLKDGKQGKELLNYNILEDRMMYVDQKGDTLAIGKPDQVKKITINETGFYYDKKECMEEIAHAPAASLVIKRKVTIVYEKKGPFGVPNTAGTGIDTYTDLPSSGFSYHLMVNEDAVVKKRVSYFLLTNEGVPLPATKPNFLSVFAKNKESINTYLNTNRINFNKEQDLVQLLGIAGSAN